MAKVRMMCEPLTRSSLSAVSTLLGATAAAVVMAGLVEWLRPVCG